MNRRHRKKLRMGKTGFKHWKDYRFNVIVNAIVENFEINYPVYRRLNDMTSSKPKIYIVFIDHIADSCIYACTDIHCKHATAFKLDCSINDIIGSSTDVIMQTTGYALKVNVKTRSKKKYYESKKLYRLNKS